MKRMTLAMASLCFILGLTTPAQPQSSDQTGTFEFSNQPVAGVFAHVPDAKVVSGDFDGDGKVDDIALVAERFMACRRLWPRRRQFQFHRLSVGFCGGERHENRLGRLRWRRQAR